MYAAECACTTLSNTVTVDHWQFCLKVQIETDLIQTSVTTFSQRAETRRVYVQITDGLYLLLFVLKYKDLSFV